MRDLRSALGRYREYPGVEHLVLLGRDGLVVQHAGWTHADEEAVAARVPGLAVACDALGRSAGRGEFITGVLEFEGGVVVIAALSGDLLLAILLQGGVGFAPLLRRLRHERQGLVELL